MCRLRLCATLLISCLSSFVHELPGQHESNTMLPPVAGRPDNFTGAIGSYRVETRAQPTQLRAEDALLFTVRITGTGSLENVPRPDLRRETAFIKRFQVDNLGDRYLSAARAREFDYRLRPRNATVTAIPPVSFVFFRPGAVPAEKGYETTYAPAIRLSVKPRDAVKPDDVQGAAVADDIPASVRKLVVSADVLRRDRLNLFPSALQILLLVIAPFVACGLWYAIWRRAYPDGRHRTRQRRSRAARRAIKSLRNLDRLDSSSQLVRTEAALVDYLCERTDLGPADPTPREVAAHMQHIGVSTDLAQDVAAFFKACDTARFAPSLPLEERNWSAQALRLILALES
jgi:hypothetical protein